MYIDIPLKTRCINGFFDTSETRGGKLATARAKIDPIKASAATRNRNDPVINVKRATAIVGLRIDSNV